MAHNHGATGHAAHNKHRKARCEAYKASGRREVNKAVKLFRHFERLVGAGLTDAGEVRDFCADIAFQKLSVQAKDTARKIIQKRRNVCAAGQMA